MCKKLFFSSRISLIIISLIAFSGCPDRLSVVQDKTQPEQILAELSGTVKEDDILKSIVQLELATAGGVYPTRAVLIARKPSYLRLELLPLMGTPDFFLAATPRKLRILLAGKGEYYRGAPTAENLARFLPGKFSLEEIVTILTGGFPIAGGPGTTVGIKPDKDFLLVEIKGKSGWMQKIWIDEHHHPTKFSHYDEHNQEIYNIQHEYYEEGKPLAGKITVRMAGGRTMLSVSYSDPEIEKGTADLSIFDLPPPAGVKTILMD
ncbi:MAG TPA: DUF4292 domain-containing protein [Smithellaceae bacterium]|nr:DUF4292 domain-containing protein [Smithellaceae bacterium]